MKNIMKVCLLLIMFISGVFPFSASATENSGDWNEMLKQNSLSEIAKTIHNGKKMKWPKILSPQAAEKLTKDERTKQADALKLAERLFEKIKEYESGIDKSKDDNIKSVITTYSDLGKDLRLSGGFVNLVLADSVYRLALSHIAVFLVRKPWAYQQGKEMLDETGLPVFSIEEFARLFLAELKQADGRNRNACACCKLLLSQAFGLALNRDFARVESVCHGGLLIAL